MVENFSSKKKFNKPEFSIIGAFNTSDKESFLRSFFKIVRINMKRIVYYLFNMEQYEKYKKLKKINKLTHGCKVYGHKALLLSLLRGLNNLHIKYTYNKITKYTKYVVLLWADKSDLDIIEKIKTKQKIKVVTVPTACKYDYEYIRWQFPHEKAVDVALYPSNWVANVCEEKAKGQDLEKIKVWPSGVELPSVSSKVITHRCIVYFKKLLVNEELLKLLQEMNIDYDVLEYTKYTFDDWQKKLKLVDFVIFYQDCQETQGLALAEAWSYNVPTLVKTTKKNSLEGTAPYLTSQNGEYFTDLEELESILLDYKKDSAKFLSKFSPREYVCNNMSDTKSVELLLDILEKIP